MIHLKQSVIKGTEHEQETVSQKVNEAINAITNQNAKITGYSNSETEENAEQREKEGK
jgi:hypothetical protein